MSIDPARVAEIVAEDPATFAELLGTSQKIDHPRFCLRRRRTWPQHP
jgi:hypothetical protein